MPSPASSATPRLTLGPDGAVRRIVVPVLADAGHDRGLDVARAWAQRWQLPVLLLSVDTGTQPGAAVDAAASRHLARTRERLAAAGLDVTEAVVAGPDAVDAVVDRLTDGDLVVMGSAGATASPTASHGWQLVQRWRAPTLLVGPNVVPGPPDGPVVTGLDGSPLAEQALPAATDLAAALGTRLWLVQASPAAVVAHLDHLRRTDREVSGSAYLRSVADGLAGPGWQAGGTAVGAPTIVGREVGWELVQGDDGAGALVDFARQRAASALVLTTHGRSGLRPEVLGSTCLAVVAGATAPVLVSMPEDHEQAILSP